MSRRSRLQQFLALGAFLFAVYWIVDGSPLIAVGWVIVGLLNLYTLRRDAEAVDDAIDV
ncbi:MULTISPECIES: hypothetical protein [Haloferax]|uniref:Uncharacterized protein n=1 Tax=Haloferax gibbonsii TaxID=35746 RepID=A0A871BHN9_HALGI|nr:MULTISPECIES: hypothetical protein [Haloferax]QOS12667.1 uncharacterized protein HfgLR_12655 [Haloferax gibbonsii]